MTFNPSGYQNIVDNNYGGQSIPIAQSQGSYQSPNGGDIRAYEPNWWGRQKEGNILQNIFYDTANGFYIFAQHFTLVPTNERMNLDRTGASFDDQVLGVSGAGMSVFGGFGGSIKSIGSNLANLSNQMVNKSSQLISKLPRFKFLRGTGGNINGFTVSSGKGYGAKPRFDFHKLSNTFNSRETSLMTIPKWLDGWKLLHWHRGKGNNLKYHRPWEIGPDGKRRW